MPTIVLDTNVVLDWLLFAEPSVAGLAAAVERRQVRWVVTGAMRDELNHVLDGGLATSRQADAGRLLGAWDAHAVTLAAPPVHRLACTDPDDQKFIDLAMAAQARWLVSRDRALLALARRAAALGLAIVTPQGWQRLQP